MKNIRHLSAGLLLFVGFTPLAFSQTASKNLPSELAAARHQVIETREFKIERLHLGLIKTGENTFSVTIKNKTNDILLIGLDLSTQPGLWLRKRFQKQFVFQIGPNQQKRVEAIYQFSRITPEATLLVRFGHPIPRENGASEIKDFFFDRRYYVGRDNKAVNYDSSNFIKHESEHFVFYCYKNSLAETDFATIREMRESAFHKISELLQVNYDRKIRLVFYPDGETKKQDIGHIGDGYAFANNIVEVYNEQTKLDPFHEITHILAGKLGNPPAIFNEGLAVYMSQRLGADALKYLGSPGKTVDQASLRFVKEGKLIKLEELIKFTEIGSEKSQPPISYAEAASFVKYLIETYGAQNFRKTYEKTQNSDEPVDVLRNVEILREIYGKPLFDIEVEWLHRINTV